MSENKKKIRLVCLEDYRSFKKDFICEFPFNKKVLYLMGANGSGKSTIVQAIRGKLNSNADAKSKWNARNVAKEISEKFDITIDGFDKMYHIDIDGLDNPHSMYNAACAEDFIDFGGFDLVRYSSGEKTIAFLGKIKREVEDSEETLIIIDELDNHLDFRLRNKFIAVLNNMFPLSYKLIITHDIFLACKEEGEIACFDSIRNGNKSYVTNLFVWDEKDKDLFLAVETGCVLKNILKEKDNKDNKNKVKEDENDKD